MHGRNRVGLHLSVSGTQQGSRRPTTRPSDEGKVCVTMRTVVIVGNPKPQSRTLHAAVALVRRLTGAEPDQVYDLVDFGAGLLTWGDPAVAEAVRTVGEADVAIFASPTYKATYTGLLKLFIDQMAGDGLAGVTVVPMMLGGGPAHAMAPEVFLRPVLVELGASCPVRSLYVLDSEWESSPAIEAFLTAAHAVLGAPVAGAAS